MIGGGPEPFEREVRRFSEMAFPEIDRSVSVAGFDHLDHPTVPRLGGVACDGRSFILQGGEHRPVVRLDDLQQQAPDHRDGLVPGQLDQLLVEASGDQWVLAEIVEEVHLVVVALLETLDGAGRSQCGEPAYGGRLDQAARLEDVLERGVVQLEQEGGVPGDHADVGSLDTGASADAALDLDERFALEDAQRLSHDRA